MWTNIKEAIELYGSRKNTREYIYARNYCLPWPPTVLNMAQIKMANTFNGKINSIQINTPSIGQYWPTHPTYRYSRKQVVFIKCSEEDLIKKEFDHLNEMRRNSISVPSPLAIYGVSEEDWNDEKNMGNIKKGAFLVEEFLYSISLGHALVDERININELIKMVLKELDWLHHVGVHGDMKHQHIRVCLRSDVADKLIFEEPKAEYPEIKIGRVCIIDVEAFEEKQDEEHYLKDLKVLYATTKDYLLRLESDNILARKVTIISPKKRNERFMKLLNAIAQKYYLKKDFWKKWTAVWAAPKF